jgi:hypothetical protein
MNGKQGKFKCRISLEVDTVTTEFRADYNMRADTLFLLVSL